MARSLESRFEQYVEVMVAGLGHADRHAPAGWYLKGLVLPGGRKSVEPMAARVQPHNVRSAHQSMHHLVAESDWSDEALLAAVAKQVVPVLTDSGRQHCVWIVDDTGFPKQGKHSVGVARQYCGRLGKTDNCQVAVSLSLATAQGSLPLAYQLYLAREWTDDVQRRERVRVPPGLGFRTKGEIAWGQIEAALTAGIPRGVVLTDAGYGDEAALRDRLREQGIPYAVGIKSGTAVWWGDAQPAPTVAAGRGRPRVRVQRDDDHQPISVTDLAHRLPRSAFRTVKWREGASGVLASRFARVRVMAAQGNHCRPEEWLIIEWPAGDAKPVHYWLSWLPENLTFKDLVNTIKARWRIEHDYLELKGELGLGHYEGRNWRGFHHHASLCIAAYGFLMLERFRRGKKNAARFKAPALPKGFRPRGAGSDATAHPLVDRHRALPPGKGHRSNTPPVPMLR